MTEASLHPSSSHPTIEPSAASTDSPSASLAPAFSFQPSSTRSESPSALPSAHQSVAPTFSPTVLLTITPTSEGSDTNSFRPTAHPSSLIPSSLSPSQSTQPSFTPSVASTSSPSPIPSSGQNSLIPTAFPSTSSTSSPTFTPTALFTSSPTVFDVSSSTPTLSPTTESTSTSSPFPTVSNAPTSISPFPSISPTLFPSSLAPSTSDSPSHAPFSTSSPTVERTISPTASPTTNGSSSTLLSLKLLVDLDNVNSTSLFSSSTSSTQTLSATLRQILGWSDRNVSTYPTVSVLSLATSASSADIDLRVMDEVVQEVGRMEVIYGLMFYAENEGYGGLSDASQDILSIVNSSITHGNYSRWLYFYMREFGTSTIFAQCTATSAALLSAVVVSPTRSPSAAPTQNAGGNNGKETLGYHSWPLVAQILVPIGAVFIMFILSLLCHCYHRKTFEVCGYCPCYGGHLGKGTKYTLESRVRASLPKGYFHKSRDRALNQCAIHQSEGQIGYDERETTALQQSVIQMLLPALTKAKAGHPLSVQEAQEEGSIASESVALATFHANPILSSRLFALDVANGEEKDSVDGEEEEGGMDKVSRVGVRGKSESPGIWDDLVEGAADANVPQDQVARSSSTSTASKPREEDLEVTPSTNVIARGWRRLSLLVTSTMRYQGNASSSLNDNTNPSEDEVRRDREEGNEEGRKGDVEEGEDVQGEDDGIAVASRSSPQETVDDQIPPDSVPAPIPLDQGLESNNPLRIQEDEGGNTAVVEKKKTRSLRSSLLLLFGGIGGISAPHSDANNPPPPLPADPLHALESNTASGLEESRSEENRIEASDLPITNSTEGRELEPDVDPVSPPLPPASAIVEVMEDGADRALRDAPVLPNPIVEMTEDRADNDSRDASVPLNPIVETVKEGDHASSEASVREGSGLHSKENEKKKKKTRRRSTITLLRAALSFASPARDSSGSSSRAATTTQESVDMGHSDSTQQTSEQRGLQEIEGMEDTQQPHSSPVISSLTASQGDLTDRSAVLLPRDGERREEEVVEDEKQDA
eukprot:gene9860-10906_t